MWHSLKLAVWCNSMNYFTSCLECILANTNFYCEYYIYLALQYMQAQGDMVITRLFEDGPALLPPLIIDPGSCHLLQQLQTLGIWRQCKLVDLEEKKTVTQLITCT